MIWEKLDENTILLELKAKNTDDVMDALGSRLIETGYAKPDFVQALKEREKEFPTGIDIGDYGIAIPHTNASYVYKGAVAIAILEKPVSFVQMGTEDETIDVKVIFMLCIDNPNTHLDVLQNITKIFQDKDLLHQLETAKNPKEIIEIIQNKERSL